jgi:hypothetical protein
MANAFEAEHARARSRRLGFVERPWGHADEQWALALSGGGIRSATFSLGVLQALARCPAPAGGRTLLHQFDQLSTVSGGGYVGSFFSSLFVPGRLSGRVPGSPGETPEAVADRAAQALREEPPGRMHADTAYDPRYPGRAALAWLRDNGRYLAPTGAGDYLFAAAMAIRNWAALHYALGTVICLVLGLVTLLRLQVEGQFPTMFGPIENGLPGAPKGLWWCTLWLWEIPLAVVALAPLGVAYWYSHGSAADDAKPRHHRLSLAALVGLLICTALAAIGWWVEPGLAWPRSLTARLCWAASATSGFALLWYLAATVLTQAQQSQLPVVSALRQRWRGEAVNGMDQVRAERLWLTQRLTDALRVALVLGALATVDTLAYTLFMLWDRGFPALPVTAFGALVWVVRTLATSSSEKAAASWVKRLPLDTLALVAGVLLWLLVAVVWDVLLLKLSWDGMNFAPGHLSPADTLMLMRRLGVVLGVSLGLGLAVGWFVGFVNLSTLQPFYSARLMRAYLGASNHRRFDPGDRTRGRSVAESVPGDSLSLAQTDANPRAPQHLINVCVNQTSDPAEQLVQRDRKGKPLAVWARGFYLDGQAHAFHRCEDDTEVAQPLSLGEWVGVSGAAFTTGLGRATNLGLSLVLGFGNVRLGRWWPSGAGRPQDEGGGWLRRLFKTQAYLLDELRGDFHGLRRHYQYLSDGGHFENTAVYELLRPQRQVRLIVVTDCGADPDCNFDDLANLMRLARIDHGVELRINTAVVDEPALQGVFGLPSDLARPEATDHCAMLVDAHAPDGTLQARIIVIKPRMVRGVALDVVQYRKTHPAFPQQPTGDQFYDEAQWESYRKLGVWMGTRVFPQQANDAYAQAFWQHVLVPPA